MSKFKEILFAAGRTSEETEGGTPDSTLNSRTQPQPKVEASPKQSAVDTPEAELEPSPPKRGRPKAKRSDPNFTQISAYIRKDTHRQVKMKLLELESEQDLSELIQELLQQWLHESN